MRIDVRCRFISCFFFLFFSFSLFFFFLLYCDLSRVKFLLVFCFCFFVLVIYDDFLLITPFPPPPNYQQVHISCTQSNLRSFFYFISIYL
ncbi:hypothetical protein GGR50DRAFT_684409 [Xylaria sp. CBS 124048]|nr:hypothetical protein GGR50DRAFT_684409 [Xylaria sp. CBS 124048]